MISKSFWTIYRLNKKTDFLIRLRGEIQTRFSNYNQINWYGVPFDTSALILWIETCVRMSLNGRKTNKKKVRSNAYRNINQQPSEKEIYAKRIYFVIHQRSRVQWVPFRCLLVNMSKSHLIKSRTVQRTVCQCGWWWWLYLLLLLLLLPLGESFYFRTLIFKMCHWAAPLIHQKHTNK